ncbi:MAG: AAA family ATPase [Bacillota bacterium]
MKILNRKYRVINKLQHTDVIRSYTAFNIYSPETIVQLNVIDKRALPDKYWHQFFQCYKQYQSLGSEYFLKDIEFDFVKNIDGKATDGSLIYFVNEYIEKNCSIDEFITNTEEYDRLVMFAELCQWLNSLYSIGITYKMINFENILFHYNGDKHIFKLKSLAYNILSQYIKASRLSVEHNGNAVPESDERPDINILGLFLLTLFKQENSAKITLYPENAGGENSFSIDYKKLVGFASRLIGQANEKPYDSISKALCDFNMLFGFDFKPYKLKDIDRITTFKPLVGRRRELDYVSGIYTEDRSKTTETSVFLVHGDEGIGKTHFLMELKNIFSIRGIDVYSAFDLQTEEDSGDRKAIIKILKSIMEVSDRYLLDEYEQEIIRSLPELNRDRPNALKNINVEHYDERTFLWRTIDYVNRVIKENPTVFIFDNIDYADDTTIDIVEMLFNNNLCGNKVYVLSYTGQECYKNEKLKAVLERLKNSPQISHVYLEGLSFDESAEYINTILPGGKNANIISNRIYEFSKGNPLYIQEMIKSMLLNGIIFFNYETDAWKVTEKINELEIPQSIEEIMENNINFLSDKEMDILRILSVFNIPVSVEVLNMLLEKKWTGLIIKELVYKGLITISYVKDKKLYKLQNNMLKYLIYKKIADPYKKLLHQIAAQVLEDLVKVERSTYFHELLYHLEKAGAETKAIKHCVENAEIMEKVKNNDECIRSLERAALLYKSVKMKSHYDECSLLIRLGFKRYEKADYEKALECFNTAFQYAKKERQYKLCVDVLVNISKVYHMMNNTKENHQAINKAKAYLKKVNYTFGELNISIQEARFCYRAKDYEKQSEIAKQAVSLCINEYACFKGEFYYLIGTAQQRLKLFEEAINNCELALKSYEVFNDLYGMINSNIVLANLYEDCWNDRERSLNCLIQARQVNKQLGSLLSEMHIAANTVRFYVYDNFKAAYENIRDTQAASKKLGNKRMVFWSNIYMLFLHILWFKYDKAFHYFEQLRMELKISSDYGIYNSELLCYLVGLFFDFGDYNEMTRYAAKVKDTRYIVGYSADSTVALYTALADAIKNNSLSSEVFNKIVLSLRNIKEKDDRKYYTYKAAMLLYDKGWIEASDNIINSISNEEPEDDSKSAASLIKKYIELSKKVDCKELYLLIEQCSAGNCIYIGAKAAKKLGDDSYTKENHYEALIYYTNALGIIKSMISSIPPKYHGKFLKHHGFYEMLNRYKDLLRLLAIKNKRIDKIAKFSSIEKIITDNLIKELLKQDQVTKYAKSIITLNYGYKAAEFDELIELLDLDTITNMEYICQYIAYELLANRVIITKADYDGEFVLASSNKSLRKPDDLRIFKLAESRMGPIAFNLHNRDENRLNTLYDEYGITAAICIPIIANFSEVSLDSYSSRTVGCAEERNIIGYIYAEAFNFINKTDLSFLSSCRNAQKLAVLNIERNMLYSFTDMHSYTAEQVQLSDKALENAWSETAPGCYISNKLLSDSHKSVIITQMLKLIKENVCHVKKLEALLQALCSTIGAQYAALFDASAKEPGNLMACHVSADKDEKEVTYNWEMIKAVIENSHSIYMTDWDNIGGYDNITRVPYWNSIMIVPVVKNGCTKGVFYAAVDMSIKEFTLNDAEFVNVLSSIAAAFLA